MNLLSRWHKWKGRLMIAKICNWIQVKKQETEKKTEKGEEEQMGISENKFNGLQLNWHWCDFREET